MRLANFDLTEMGKSYAPQKSEKQVTFKENQEDAELYTIQEEAAKQ